MDIRNNSNKKPSKAVICFHGTGSKGSIFQVQLARICNLLANNFHFIFVDGPLESAAGPGILPTFANSEPYHSWFGGHGMTIEESLQGIRARVKAAVDQWTAIHPEVEIVGGIGFSEGALALAILLWDQQQQQHHGELRQSGLPPLCFAVMSCCYFPNEASLWLNARAHELGLSRALIDVPTLHIHANRDFCLGRARKLVRMHYQPEFSTVVVTEAGHHLPAKKEEVAEIVELIIKLDETAGRRSLGNSDAKEATSRAISVAS